MLKRKSWRLLVAAVAAPSILATSIAANPAEAVDVGDNRHGTTEIVPKPVTPEVPVQTTGTPLGAITAATATGNQANLTAAGGKYRITFLDKTTFRVEATKTTFVDPANTPQGDAARTANIVVGNTAFAGSPATVTDGDVIKVSTAGGVSIEIVKASGQMTAKNADGSVIWAEAAPLSFGSSSTTQKLAVGADEQFLGGGMQNGRSIHTGATINIAVNHLWDDDGYPNAVPYYMSSAGYGILRNTFARGTYDFAAGTTTHQETRFDAYTFAGDYKQALDSYTKLTGRPHLPPVYALEYGDADCYNRGSATYTSGTIDPKKLRTPQALDVAKGFVDNDMPGGWMLVNDGYGCEYVELPETVDAIEQQTNLKVGLWTQRALTNQPYEVGTAGIRLRKLDVAWVGSGYRMALTGCEAAHNGIEANSDARGTALLVEGWAGAQRCGMVWTGDHTGDLDAVRWQVSALMGSGNSGQPFATGDVDGIFGGSAESYVRDLQWKAFAPALYSMSGWAGTDKRPWLYGDEATAINRKYLQLRQQLMPYIYSLSQHATTTGTPVMRALAMEYPTDLGSYSVEANTEFLLGTDYLVAPVYNSAKVRSGIYLPAGEKWIDYWTGRTYEGGRVLNGHPAPLDKLPVFVRAGALVPQGIVARNYSLVPEDSELTVQAYPSGASSYNLYEDEKDTRAYKNGEVSWQKLDVAAPEAGPGDVTVTIGKREGNYVGKAASRPYRVVAHTDSEPSSVTLDGVAVTKAASVAALDAVAKGWVFDASNGTVVVKTGPVASTASAVVKLIGTSAVGGKDPDGLAADVSLAMPTRVVSGQDTTVTVTFVNTGAKAKTGLVLTPNLPTGWTVVSSVPAPTSVAAGATVTATFVVKAGDTAKAGDTVLGATATYLDATGTQRTLTGAVETELTYSSLAAAFNHVSITSVEGVATGNFDGGGNSFSRDALAAVGAVAGKSVTVGTGTDAITYTWPGPVDAPNSVTLQGQTISLSGQGSHLAILASASAGQGVTGDFTITYTDGTTAQGQAGFPNWLPQGTNTLGSTVAFKSMGRNSAANGYEYATTGYQVYQSKIAINPAKTVQSVTLGTDTRLKIFAWTIVSQDLPAAPTKDVFASDHPWVSASNGYGTIGIDVANLDPDQTQEQGQPLVTDWTDPATGAQRTYEKGLGVHANSKISYYLAGQCTRFTAEVAQEKGFTGSVVFKVTADGRDAYQSKTFVKGMAPETIDLDVTGVGIIDLAVTYPTTQGAAHGIWGNAKFTCAESTTTTPPATTPPATTPPVTTPPVTTPPVTTPPVTTPPATTTPPKYTPVAPYEVAGYHFLNGREWFTTCEKYGSTVRCRTDIWATVVIFDGKNYVAKTGWHFNNLTYPPLLTRAQWGTNPLARNATWTVGDRVWRTECNTLATGRNNCRSYLWSQVIVATKQANGTTTYARKWAWQFNNIVRFATS